MLGVIHLSSMVSTTKDYLKRNETLVMLCAGELLFMIGMGFVGPILPVYVQSFGVTAAEIGTKVGLLTGIYGVGRVAIDIPAGHLAHYIGRRPLLIAGSLLVTLTALALGLATNYWQLVVFRFLQV